MNKPIKVGDRVTNGRYTGTVKNILVVQVITDNKFVPHNMLTVNIGNEQETFSEDIGWRHVSKGVKRCTSG